MRRRFIAVPLLVAALAGAGFMTAALASSGSGARAAARALTARAKKHPIHPFGFSVPVRAVASQATTCQVLTLVLGPLHLNLLGLVVDLNKVSLQITATRGGGVLGDLFCNLADN